MQRPGSFADQLVRQDLHVAGEHHEIGPGLLDQPPDRRLLLELGLLGHRQVVEGMCRSRDCRRLSRGWLETTAVGSIAARRCASDRAGRRGNGRTSRPGSSPGGVGAVAQLPGHREASAIAAKPVRRACNRPRSAGSNTTRMKKSPVSSSSNCWASRMFARRRKVDTAGTMPGRSGQDRVSNVLVIGHGETDGRSGDRVEEPNCGPALSPRIGLRQSGTGVTDEQSAKQKR